MFAPSYSPMFMVPLRPVYPQYFDLGILTSDFSQTEGVNFQNTSDVYFFELSDFTPVTISLLALGSSPNVVGGIRPAPNKANDPSIPPIEILISPESVNLDLEPGTYAVNITGPQNDLATYRIDINLNADSGDDDDHSDEGIRDLGVLRGRERVSDSVDSDNSVDFYSFTLPSNGEFELSLRGLDADVDVALLDSPDLEDDSIIAVSNRSGSRNERIQRDLDGGEYYIAVYSYDNASSDYTLILNADIENDDEIRDLGVLRGRERVSDSVDSDNLLDFYSFTLPSNGEFKLSLRGLDADVDVALLDSPDLEDDSIIAVSNRSGSRNERIQRDLDEGKYYIAVYSYDNASSDYTLILNAILGNNENSVFSVAF